jgi:HEAT repeat protein
MLRLSEVKIILRILLDCEKIDPNLGTLRLFHELDEKEFLVLRKFPLNEVFELLKNFQSHLRKKLKSTDNSINILNRTFNALLYLGYVDPVEYLAKIYLVDKNTKESKSDFAYLMIDNGNSKAIPYLLEMLKDRSPYVKGQAAEALGYVGDKTCLEALRKCLTDHRLDSQGIPVSEQAEDSIRAIEPKESV